MQGLEELSILGDESSVKIKLAKELSVLKHLLRWGDAMGSDGMAEERE